MKKLTLPFRLALLALLLAGTRAPAQSNAFTYQGRLLGSNGPAEGAFDFEFRLFAGATNATPLASPVTNAAVTVSNGLFTTAIDPGTPFDGSPRWLQIAVRPADGTTNFVVLEPRQALTPVPQAFHARVAAQANTAAFSSNSLLASLALSSATAGLATNSLVASQAVHAASADLAAALGPGPELTALTRLLGQSNSVPGDWSALAGGSSNTVGSSYSALGGGAQNVIQSNSAYSVIAGGTGQLVGTNAPFAALLGGQANSIESGTSHAFIGGGRSNIVRAGATAASIPGGEANTAAGSGSLAAGRRAAALHDGTFVWSSSDGFASTSSNQFLIHAPGGVGIGTNQPQAALHVAGTVQARDFAGDGSRLTALSPGQLGAGTISNLLTFGLDTGAPFAVTASNRVMNLNSDLLDGLDSGALWQIGGNAGTLGGTSFLGTVDNQALELRVNNARVLRLEPHPVSPNLIGGSRGNHVAAGVAGATIAGGGTPNLAGLMFTNRVTADFGTVSGGLGNSVGGASGTISGGGQNSIAVGADGSAVNGGTQNRILSGAQYARIGGGNDNLVSSNAAFASIGGGSANAIAEGGQYAVIGGGLLNSIDSSATFSTVPGGFGNMIGRGANYATVGGGSQNLIQRGAEFATIGGGDGHLIASNAAFSTIAGGEINTIALKTLYSAIGGGTFNSILSNACFAAIPGGANNVIGRDSLYAAIGGGRDNAIGASSTHAVIAGGMGNVISNASPLCVIAGGDHNAIDLKTLYSAIGGGTYNVIASNACFAVAAGGAFNSIGRDALYSSVSGGSDNTIAPGALYAAIPGGRGAAARSYGQQAFASGSFSTAGDAQVSRYVLRGVSTSTNVTEIFLDGVIRRISVPTNSAWTFDVTVNGVDASGNSGARQFRGRVKNVSGTTTLVVAKDDDLGADAGFTGTAAVEADAANQALVVKVTAGALTRWVASIRTVEVRF